MGALQRSAAVLWLGPALALALAEPCPAQSRTGTPRLMQGPMLGAVGAESISIWARASGAFDVALEFDTAPDLAAARRTAPVRALKAERYIVVFQLTGLSPDTRYYYRVWLDGRADPYLAPRPAASFRTAPAAGAPARFRVAFGSCARFQEDPVQPIWRAVERAEPDLFFWLGDNAYGDALDPDILAEEIERQREVPGLQPFLSRVPQLAVWDDHDYGLNNHDRTSPIKDRALAVFRRSWPNPGSGLPDVPGVFFAWSYGGVDFFFLDVRYHRSPNADPDGPDKTMLGAAQLDWLKRGLLASRAPFKLLVSGSGWSEAKGQGGDAWSAFLHERDALFEFIRAREIGGVVLLSGDTHVGELNAIPWSGRGGYDFYDLASSPLAQTSASSWLERRPELRIRPAYGSGPNFGVLDFDATGETPRLRFELRDAHGAQVWDPLELTPAELVNGVASWPQKIDPRERRRHEQHRAGLGYYDRVGP